MIYKSASQKGRVLSFRPFLDSSIFISCRGAGVSRKRSAKSPPGGQFAWAKRVPRSSIATRICPAAGPRQNFPPGIDRDLVFLEQRIGNSSPSCRAANIQLYVHRPLGRNEADGVCRAQNILSQQPATLGRSRRSRFERNALVQRETSGILNVSRHAIASCGSQDASGCSIASPARRSSHNGNRFYSVAFRHSDPRPACDLAITVQRARRQMFAFPDPACHTPRPRSATCCDPGPDLRDAFKRLA